MRNVKYAVAVAVILLPVLCACAQQEQLSVERHSGQHLHYTVMLNDGDIDKVTDVRIGFRTTTQINPPADKPGATSQFFPTCQKTSDPHTWNCDVVIPTNIVDGDYHLYQVTLTSNQFSKTYNEDFDVPVVPIKNPSTFTPPSKVTVKQQP